MRCGGPPTNPVSLLYNMPRSFLILSLSLLWMVVVSILPHSRAGGLIIQISLANFRGAFAEFIYCQFARAGDWLRLVVNKS